MKIQKILSLCFLTLLFSFGANADSSNAASFFKKKPTQKKWLKRKTLFHLGGILNETSGAVYDRNQDVMWSLGDSGEKVLARTDMKTRETVIVPIVGRSIARDREELKMDRDGFLWILSTGDNHKRRKEVEINKVDPKEYFRTGEVKVLKTITINYPYGPIDVEGAFIHESSLYLIQKNFFGKTWIYTIDISINAEEKQIAKRFKRIKRSLAKLITAACIDDQDEVYVLTYWGTYRLPNWKSASKVRPKRVKFDPFVAQAETLVCYEDKLIIARETGRFWWSRK